MNSTRHVPPSGECLGIDLGGARMDTTGWALLVGGTRPRLHACGLLAKSKTADAAERVLRELVEEHAPAVLAVDAPLTLPPCLTCPSSCRGPGLELCELESAKLVWTAGGNPVTERWCEVKLRSELKSGPLPTMRIGQIAGRGVALARRLHGMAADPTMARAPTVLEVYPYATLHRLSARCPELAPRTPGESDAAFTSRVTDALMVEIDGLDDWRAALANGHVLDALIAAYTGWLSPDRLAHPPQGFNVASGWIWVPAVVA